MGRKSSVVENKYKRDKMKPFKEYFIEANRIPKTWKEIPFEDVGDGIYVVRCPNCGTKRDIYDKTLLQKRAHEYACDNCYVKFKVKNKKVQAAT